MNTKSLLKKQDKMPYGKYGGTIISDIINKDIAYVKNLYIYEQFDFDDNLKFLLGLNEHSKKSKQVDKQFSKGNLARINQGHNRWR